jgi:twitching motility protein PilT
MATKIDALVRSFLRSNGEALYLVPGERIFAVKGSAKAVMGREPLSEESFEAVIGELIPGESGRSLSDRNQRMTLQLDPGSAPVDIQFGFFGQSPSMMISRLASPDSTEMGVPTLSSVQVSLPRADEVSMAFRMLEDAQAGARPPEPGPPPTSMGPVKHVLTTVRPPAPVVKPVLRPPVRLSLDDLLARLLDLGAQNVILASGTRPVFRVRGELLTQDDIPVLASVDVERLVGQVAPESRKADLQAAPDLDFAFEVDGSARFLVNVFRDRAGLGAVVRQAPFRIPQPEELLLPPLVTRFVGLTDGLVLVTGPAGSGRTTTIATLLDGINQTRAAHVVTVEDPIEFVHAPRKSVFNQREVGTHTKGFLEALRSASREDPDVVYVSHLDDPAVFLAALEIADAGRLVFGVLRHPTAAGAVHRVLEQYPGDRQPQVRLLLADALRGVAAQVLCRRVDGGVVPAFEVLLANSAVRGLIREGKTYQLPSLLSTSKAQGMFSLNDSLLELVKAGVVDPREAYLKSDDKAGLAATFRSLGVPLPTETLADAGRG